MEETSLWSHFINGIVSSMDKYLGGKILTSMSLESRLEEILNYQANFFKNGLTNIY